MLVAIVGAIGLTDIVPLGLLPWARWFLMTFLFFFGLILAMHGLSNVD